MELLGGGGNGFIIVSYAICLYLQDKLRTGAPYLVLGPKE